MRDSSMFAKGRSWVNNEGAGSLPEWKATAMKEKSPFSKETFSEIKHPILKERVWMVHLESTGTRWSSFTPSKYLGVKMREVYGLVLNTKSWEG